MYMMRDGSIIESGVHFTAPYDVARMKAAGYIFCAKTAHAKIPIVLDTQSQRTRIKRTRTKRKRTGDDYNA